MTNCNKCNAEMVLNPRTNKMFCKDKCWLNQFAVTPNTLGTPFDAPVVKPGIQRTQKDLDIIRESALKSAVEFAKVVKSDVLEVDVLGIATDFENWILR